VLSFVREKGAKTPLALKVTDAAQTLETFTVEELFKRVPSKVLDS